ncbi:MAG: HAMP domain-containing protein [Candidatus Tectomicrobia bacterium]|nr:HAMP domain-containing protein [Candidatus Tectomicrobia bacterium]
MEAGRIGQSAHEIDERRDAQLEPNMSQRSREAMPLIHPRFWQRLSVRVSAFFVAVTLLGIGLVGLLIYQNQKQMLEETLGVLLLNIARTGALLIDPVLHAEIEATLIQESEAYQRVRTALAAIQDENQVATPIYTLTGFDAEARQAHFMVTSRGPGYPSEPYPLVPALLEPIGQAFLNGVATHTHIYKNQSGTWITAFAPVRDANGRVFAVLDVDYQVDVYLDRLAGLRYTVLGASFIGGIVALVIGVLLAHRVTGPISALTRGVARVADGDLSQPLPVQSKDEVGELTRAFNEMLEGLRQRDFIRDTLGRYVSPEVARTLLESPEGLRLGGEKREVTILMSDLRGYTRLAEEGDPATVMEFLNGYLGRMTEIIIEHGGTINEFMGDGILAIFGAPLPYQDHAERAAACTIAMQLAMEEVNHLNVVRGLPRLEMGIGLNTGEAVVGNIGSEKRAKYGVVGNAINLAARVEGCTVGGQILLSPFTYEQIREIAEVGQPLPVEVKGIRDPLLLYELKGLSGNYARRLPDARMGEDLSVLPTALPLLCSVIEGKAVRSEQIAGEVIRLSSRRLEARLDAHLTPLTNIRFRLHYPALMHDSNDLYGKVLAADEQAGVWIAQIALTSVDAADRKILEGLLRASDSHG